MSRTLLLVLGFVGAALGVLWTLQGLGHVGGSPMTGVKFWALVGPLVAGLGVALVIVGLRRKN